MLLITESVATILVNYRNMDDTAAEHFSFFLFFLLVSCCDIKALSGGFPLN
jgi:hypothetical protein